MLKIPTSLLTFFVFLAVLSISAAAQTCPGSAGCLDPTFGSGGKTILSAAPAQAADQLLVQSDGKILARKWGTYSSPNWVIRLNADGMPDSGFGSGGVVSSVWETGVSNGMAIQVVNGGERILLVGAGTIASGRKTISNRLRIDRLMPDGTRDNSWGSGGTLMIDLNPGVAVAVQPDQKILIATYAAYGTLTRLNANGTIDNTFGANGVVNGGDGQAITVDSNGRIAVARLYETGNGNNAKKYASVKRFTSSGAVDNTFGNNGTAIGFQTTYSYLDLAADAFGSFIVGSSTTVSNTDSLVGRFTPLGIMDTSFSGDGVTALDYAGLPDGRAAVAAQSDGKVIVAARVSTAPNVYDVGVYRLNYNGTLDTTFGNGGKTNFDIQGDDYVASVVIQKDPACACEKILVGSGGPGGTRVSYVTFARLSTY